MVSMFAQVLEGLLRKRARGELQKLFKSLLFGMRWASVTYQKKG
jgi:hypothetical protein